MQKEAQMPTEAMRAPQKAVKQRAAAAAAWRRTVMMAVRRVRARRAMQQKAEALPQPPKRWGLQGALCRGRSDDRFWGGPLVAACLLPAVTTQ
jgi:hypothetical protein